MHPRMTRHDIQRIGITIRAVTRQHSRYWDPDIAWDVTTLGGACAYASYAMHKFLPKSTFILGTYDTPSALYTHCWVEYNGLIVDVTRTQFDEKAAAVSITTNEHQLYNAEMRGRKAVQEVRAWYAIPNWQSILLDQVIMKLGGRYEYSR